MAGPDQLQINQGEASNELLCPTSYSLDGFAGSELR